MFINSLIIVKTTQITNKCQVFLKIICKSLIMREKFLIVKVFYFTAWVIYVKK